MQAQKQRARNAAAVENGDWVTLKEGEETFVGYDLTECETEILRYRQIKQKNKTFYQIVLQCTPFYAEMGGQTGDTGLLICGDEKTPVIATKRENNLAVHIVEKLPADVTATFKAAINVEARTATACNHSATHILDYCLRTILGSHVEQKGSLVTPEALRFDFSHFQKVTDEELRQVEQMANAMVRQNIALEEHRNMPIADAKALGAIALFGEKYGDEVRVVKFGPSIELCGGTHVAATGQIGMIHIISESSVAAGIRRIEAITAGQVEKLLYVQQDMMRDLKRLFNNAPNLVTAIQHTIEEGAGYKKQIAEFRKEKEARLKQLLLDNAAVINGVKVIRYVGPAEPETAKNLAFQLRGENETVAFVSGTVFDNRPMLTVALSDDLVQRGLNASALIKEVAKLIQGGGGGQPHFAQAGGKNPDGLTAAVDAIIDHLK
jgi:alanyl-tRNA synthetase